MRNMDKWLGDGGMPLLEKLGVEIVSYDEGQAEARWVPTDLCCNPQGYVQTGTFTVGIDATMNFSVLAAMEKGETAATLEIKTTNLRSARKGDLLLIRGCVDRITRSIAFTRAEVTDDTGELVATATGTFALRRQRPQ